MVTTRSSGMRVFGPTLSVKIDITDGNKNVSTETKWAETYFHCSQADEKYFLPRWENSTYRFVS